MLAMSGDPSSIIIISCSSSSRGTATEDATKFGAKLSASDDVYKEVVDEDETLHDSSNEVSYVPLPDLNT